MNKFFTVSFNMIFICFLMVLPQAGKGQCPGTTMNCCTGYHGSVSAGTSAWSTYTGCATSETGTEAVYSFTPATTGTYSITTVNTGADADFFLMSSCGNTGTNLTGGCWDIGNKNVVLNGGTTYYLIVDYNPTTTSDDADYYIFSTCDLPLQPGCTNMGFESGFTGWYGTEGDVARGPAGALTPQYVPITCGFPSDNFALLTGGTDPYGGFPCVYNGSTSLRMGNDAVGMGNDAASIQQTFMVTATNSEFIYNYAVIFDDGGHSDNLQPFFQVDIFDQNGNQVVCGYYQVTCPGAGGFIQSPNSSEVSYKPWTPVSVNLTPYIGQYVTAKFTVSDCTEDGHFGYCYIDCACSYYEIINPDTVCAGQPATLTAPAATSYSWSPGGETTQSITVYPTVTTTYTCVITTTANTPCYATETATVVVVTTGSATASSNSPICSGEDLNLSCLPAGADSYVWSGPNNFSSGDQNPTIASATTAATGTYTVTATFSEGCTATATTAVTVNQGGAALFNQLGPYCAGATPGILPTTSTNGITGSWSPPTVSTSTAGTTIYTFTPSAGQCSSPTTMNITVNPSPNAAITNNTGTAILTCTTTSISVTATPSGAASYEWSGGATPSTADNSFTAPGTYTVTVTTANGCAANSSITITQDNAPPVITFTPMPQLCFTSPDFVLTQASPLGGIYSGTGVSGATFSPGTAGIGTHTITYNYTNLTNGCSNSATTQIVVSGLLTITVLPNNPFICNGDHISLTAGGASSFTWLPTAGLSATNVANVIASPTITTTYTVTGTNPNGCIGSTTTTVLVYDVPVLGIVAVPDDGCEPLFVNFNYFTSGPIDTNTLHWDFGDSDSPDNNSTATAPSHNFLNDGSYAIYLSALTPDGCLVSATDTVRVYKTPIADFYANPEVGYEDYPTINLIDNSVGADSWLWNFGDPASLNNNYSDIQNPFHIYTDTGTYIVQLIVSTSHNCSDTIQKPLIIYPSIVIYIPNAFTPDNDQWNDIWKPVISGADQENYQLYVFDRWGKILFYTEDMNEGWDGSNKGKKCPEDVYVYMAVYQSVTGEEFKVVRGVVMLIR